MRSRAPWIVLGVAVLAGIAVVAATPPSSSSSPMDLSKAKVVDLTHAFDEKTIYWPNSPSTFKLQKLADGATEGGYYYRMNSFCAPEHGGTHLDAPSHFAKDGWTADQIPLGKLVARGVVIDVTKQAAADPDYRLTAADLRAWEAKHGAVRGGVDRPAANGMGRALARPEEVPGRRHAGRDVESALPVLRKGVGGDPRPGAEGRGGGSRHGVHRLRPVEGLHRPPDRQRRQRAGAGEPREPRPGAGNGSVDRGAADEDRRRVGWTVEGHRSHTLEGATGREGRAPPPTAPNRSPDDL